ncbi:hypothetical protein E2N92_07165 [Methanofollis formosanus]|uniref:DUF169 domain-containing protein n=1 Tax=Methanofollis formosanus TaxID=299308 RepID=A0A8G1EGJ9_9EURY|nr:hypothetical protein [Methanofollis formosanus]QYZ79231.1 hypothetical protein E2N92_07165 [Methanofollis formosanus]
MNLIASAVTELKEQIKDSGCEDGIVALARNTTRPLCQYPRGVCVEARFGDRTGHVVTTEPLEISTRISFMYGAPLKRPVERTAACAIINAVTGFFCINRKMNACDQAHHAPCLAELAATLEGKQAYLVGEAEGVAEVLGASLTVTPEDADVLLVTGPGIISDEGLATVEAARGTKAMIFLGPSTAGVATVLGIEHWCPYGN